MSRPEAGGEPPRSAHAESAEAVLESLGSTPDGLSRAEARARLERYGPNRLQAARATPTWKIFVAQLRSVVVLLLVVAAVVAFLLGDPLEAAAIGVVLLINTLLGFFTELRARRAMEALLELEAPHATVVREGTALEIEAHEVVPGDVILLEAGQAVPADARLIETHELRTSEAPLTGESLPVFKYVDPVDADAPIADRTPMVYQGTSVVAGSGRAVVTATGMTTELGRIGGLVAGIAEEKTPLEVRLDALGRRLVWAVLAIALVVIGIGLLQGRPVGLLVITGLALAIAAVPEGLPAVSTIALAVGMRRMARRHAVVRRLPAVEALGSATVVCTDKTGTLTSGEMTVTVLWLGGREIHVTGHGYEPVGTFQEDGTEIDPEDDEGLANALRALLLSSRGDVVRVDDGWIARGDPTDAACVAAARKGGLELDAVLEEWPREDELPFSSERMHLVSWHRGPDGRLHAFVKGAPARVLDLCASLTAPEGDRLLDDDGREMVLEKNRDLAASGLRVLALAAGTVEEPTEAALQGLSLLGLVGMIDPAAPGVKETIRTFREAGIRTIMLTGDQRLTAEAIARDLGVLEPGDETIDGREFDRLSDDELIERVERVGVYSRVSPDAKLRIISALREKGEIVAMLGDGVNDAAALKRADIGVAMGRRGTDVAKEASAVVLQDDRFPTIGAAVEEGRVVFSNIRKFVCYLFSCNVAEVLVLLLAGIAGLPLPLLPLQILWLNIVTDTFPALSLALEPSDPDIMRRPPRDPHEAILSAWFTRRILFFSALITVSTLAAFGWGLAGSGQGIGHAVTLSFMTLALAQIFHLGNARSTKPVLTPARIRANPWAAGAVALTVGLQLLAVYWPPLAGTLRLEPLKSLDWLVVAPLSLLPLLVGQAVAAVRGRRSRR